MHLQSIKKPGERIRSYDFATEDGVEASYLEGTIVAYDASHTPKYMVLCDYCNYIGRAGMTVSVVLQVDCNDFANRLTYPDSKRPTICMEIDRKQFFLLNGQVWVLVCRDSFWEFLHQTKPDNLGSRLRKLFGFSSHGLSDKPATTRFPANLSEDELWCAMNTYAKSI